MELLLLFLFGAMSISFLCSVLESVLMTTTYSYINLREEEGYAPASLMKSFKDDTSRPLAAILSLNTIANTIGASGVGMQVTAVFGSKWFGLMSAITTILILVFSEISLCTDFRCNHTLVFLWKSLNFLRKHFDLIQPAYNLKKIHNRRE